MRRSSIFFAVLGTALAACACVVAVRAADPPSQPPDEAQQENEAYTTETLRGRVVWLAEGLARLYDVRTTQDAQERVLALETDDGELIPLIEDRRGRSFR